MNFFKKIFFVMSALFALSIFADNPAFQLKIKNNSDLNYISFPNNNVGINAVISSDKPWYNNYASDMCAYLVDASVHINNLYNGVITDWMHDGILTGSENSACELYMYKDYSNFNRDTWGLYSYEFANEAGQQTLITFPTPDFRGGKIPDIDSITHKMLLGNIAQEADVDDNHQDHNDEYIAIYNSLSKINGTWTQVSLGTFTVAVTLSTQYLGSFIDPGTKTNNNIYKFTIKHPNFSFKNRMPHDEIENDQKYPWVQPLHSYDTFPDRGQNFSIIFSPYEVEASNDNQTWYHLGYVLPQSMPEHGTDVISELNSGDAVFYFAKEKMTIPVGQPNAGAQFKYFKVRQWTKKPGDNTITESQVLQLPDSIDPFSGATKSMSAEINKGGSKNIKIDANIIAQSDFTYSVNAWDDKNTIKDPSDYAYFYETNSPEMGVELASNTYFVTNLFDPNDIAPLATDPRKAAYSNINKDHYLAITDLKGQYHYNPKANNEMLRFNNGAKVTDTHDDKTNYYISTGRESTQSAGTINLMAKCGAVNGAATNFTVADATNTAFNGTNSAFTAGALSVKPDGNGYRFEQSLKNAYGLDMYNPRNDNDAPISYLFFDINRDGYKNNDTLACNAAGGKSCAGVVPYTVIMNKYLALEWFAVLHNYIGSNMLFVRPPEFSNPSFAGCEINVNGDGASFYTAGINGQSCFDVNIGDERESGIGHYTNWN